VSDLRIAPLGRNRDIRAKRAFYPDARKRVETLGTSRPDVGRIELDVRLSTLEATWRPWAASSRSTPSSTTPTSSSPPERRSPPKRR
jgi:hypothetical protein